MSRLYTASFFTPGLATANVVKIGIVAYRPRYLKYRLEANLPALGPAGYTLSWPREHFTTAYVGRLERLTVEGVQRLLEPFTADLRDLVLCCYETLSDEHPETFCHRTLFREWWRNTTGEVIDEW
jgi:hypothetical protein